MEREWRLVHPVLDIPDIMDVCGNSYRDESGVVTVDDEVFRYRATMAATEQLFDRSKEFFAVCRGPKVIKTMIGEGVVDNAVLGYCWFDRGGYTTYSNDEISNAKFYHVDLDLSVRQRVELIHEMIDQHILWAHRWNIPVICSTSIRAEHEGFMKIHKRRGFTVNGSYAWIRTEKAIEMMKAGIE